MSNEKQEKDVWQPHALAWSELPLGGGFIGQDPEGREWARVWDRGGAVPSDHRWGGKQVTNPQYIATGQNASDVRVQVDRSWTEHILAHHFTELRDVRYKVTAAPERGRDGLSVTQWQFKNLYRKAVRRGVQAASDLEEHAAALRKLLESDHPERATALDMNRLNYAHQRMAESMAALDALDELAMGGTDDIDLRAALAREPKSAQAVVNAVRQHTGLMAHDGFAEHSHEVRPDHDGVRRTGKS